ncbi:hypothetical protein DZC52_03795 [Wenzhouxiangella sediminis]|uniref:Uncharacterized protein n=1 Tax=Wenzhouxiangella sediminis TaxID=1792836 RepID=A0A3E1KB41_9GAMM|nr:hypothetical protein DZC52_03795 [Wenzhouxiangella sediminis]
MIGWGSAAGLLLLPVVAMQLTDAVRWTLGDFVLAALALGVTGLALELALRIAPDTASRLGFALALAGALLMVWINAAVGIIGPSANDANLLYGFVLLMGLLTAALGNFQPVAMVRAMLATASAQVLLTVVAIVVGLGQPETSALELVAVNGFFMPFWLGSALLFRLSPRMTEDP